MIKQIYKTIIPEKHRIMLLQKLNYFKSYFYLGNKVYCNLCNTHFTHFQPHGVGKRFRENAVCLKCGSLERNRFLWLCLDGLILPQSNTLKVIHFAAEPGLKKKLKKLSFIDYQSADKFPHLGEVQADLTALPFEDNSYDFIICSHVLAHIEEEEKAIIEMKRVLKPSGKIILMTYINWDNAITEVIDRGMTKEERVIFYHQDKPLRIHGTDFKTYLSSFNLMVELVSPQDIADQEIIDQLRLDEKDAIFICQKSNSVSL